ncbi:type 2 glycerol-3-phosphate oxidase [Spiroplasma apis]|uniref:Glycerol-3-phosphate oxidase n=1 Tax=Spiroplasma apis B31 TaxID=1276258 RepID=V5RHN5_SPIAP|nr:type 2 glycerol-3-phosphate oxidase [Spiroplasma apis]AHB36039.1 glycerol-3-phosphate oxidase [Spiroplasma apis B31]
MEKFEYDICIIGAGIIGASVARELSKYKLNIIVLESNPSYAMETSEGNSGLIHGGFDAKTGKLNASLNILGKERYNDWFRELDFSHKNINSLVLAFNDNEVEHLNILYNRGIDNGLNSKEMQIINQNKILEMEPNINKDVKKALLCNSSVVIDPVELTGVLLKNAIRNGVKVKFNSKVTHISKSEDRFEVSFNEETVSAKRVINCAGHYADVISKMAGFDDFTLNTRRGEYLVLEKSVNNNVNNVLFMVPTIHGKGVLVAPTLKGKILVGPTAEENVPKEETRVITPEKEQEIIKIGKQILPNLDIKLTSLRFSGSRPIYLKTDDFYINYASKDKNFINIAGIKSPGISCAPSIADYVINLLKPFLKMEINPNYQPNEKNIFYK